MTKFICRGVAGPGRFLGMTLFIESMSLSVRSSAECYFQSMRRKYSGFLCYLPLDLYTIRQQNWNRFLKFLAIFKIF